jgi:dihydropteroate synthase
MNAFERFSLPRIMGIVNATHDSFFSGSRAPELEAAQALAERHIREGATIIDIGGESTRPGSAPVTVEEELKRVIPTVQAIHLNHPEILISVDTRNEPVARAALAAGAGMINDVSGLQHDPAMVDLVVSCRVPVCVMHMRGTPATMQDSIHFDDLTGEIHRELQHAIAPLVARGVDREQIILDPGIGFGKELHHNWSILRHLDLFTTLGYPILIGLSRKRFLGPADDPADRLYATLAAQLWCTLQGVSILRVHDVAPIARMIGVFQEIRDAD